LPGCTDAEQGSQHAHQHALQRMHTLPSPPASRLSLQGDPTAAISDFNVTEAQADLGFDHCQAEFEAQGYLNSSDCGMCPTHSSYEIAEDG